MTKSTVRRYRILFSAMIVSYRLLEIFLEILRKKLKMLKVTMMILRVI